MDISVIVASGRSDPSLCLKSLIDQRGDFEYEVILAHDSTNPPAGRFDGVRYIECPTTNPATKRNMGARASSGKVLAFIDDDAVAPPEWLERGLKTLAERPVAAGCGGPNLPPENQTPAELLTDAVLASKIGSGSGSYGSCGEAHEARIGEVHLVNFFARRAVFEKVGGFNEALGYGAEDSEFIYLCSRMAKAAFVYDPDLCVTHRRRPFGRDFFSQRFRLRKQNGRLLWTRPGMYITRKRGLVLAALPLLACLASLSIWVPLAVIVAYVALLASASRSTEEVSKLKWIRAMIMLHAVSVAGMFAGWIVPPTKAQYRGLLRRPV